MTRQTQPSQLLIAAFVIIALCLAIITLAELLLLLSQ